VRTLSRPQAPKQERTRELLCSAAWKQDYCEQSTLPLGTAQLAAGMGVAAVSQVLCFENFENQLWAVLLSADPGPGPVGHLTTRGPTLPGVLADPETCEALPAQDAVSM